MKEHFGGSLESIKVDNLITGDMRNIEQPETDDIREVSGPLHHILHFT